MRVNKGSTGSLWIGSILGLPAPVVDFVDSFGAGGLAVPDDTAGDTVSIDFAGPVVGASADNVLLTIGDFVYVSGSFSFNEGVPEAVDVATGITGAVASTQLAGLSTSATDPGTLARNTDGSMIWNLPVDTINIGIGNASVFVGYADNLTPEADGTITLADVAAADGIGLLMSGVNLGVVIMKALPTLTAPLLDLAHLRFYALRADANTAALVGVPEVTATATNVEVRVNNGEAGSAWLGNLVDAAPVIDFQQSFGLTGYQVPLSTTGTTTVAIPYTEGLIGASADQVLFQISQFVYLSGSFSFDKGPTLLVDVETGLTETEATAGGLFVGMTQSATKPTDGSLAITPDGSEIWNLPTESLTIGIASGNAFAGYSNGTIPVDVNGNISKTGLESQGSVGLFLSNVSVGLAMLRAPPLSLVLTSPVLAAADMSFFSLKADADNVALVGIPDLTVSATNLEVRVNQGAASGVWIGNLFGEDPVVNWADSFPSTSGLQIPTDTTGAHPPVTLDYTGEDIGASADQILLTIGSFVYVDGSFSFDKGPSELVDVETQLTETEAAADGLFLELPQSATAPTDGSLAIRADGSEIWNVPVGTIQLGLGNVNVFVGYADGLALDPVTHTLDQTALDAANAVGLYLAGASLALTLMEADVPVLDDPILAAAGLKFFALKSTAGSVGLVGVPDLHADRDEPRGAGQPGLDRCAVDGPPARPAGAGRQLPGQLRPGRARRSGQHVGRHGLARLHRPHHRRVGRQRPAPHRRLRVRLGQLRVQRGRAGVGRRRDRHHRRSSHRPSSPASPSTTATRADTRSARTRTAR